MSIDLTGGLHPTREHVFAERPENPEMRDSVSFWVVDDSGAVGLPRIGVEAVSSNWEDHDIQVNVTYPDGRIYRLRSTEPAVPPIGPEGKPTVLGSGGLAFRCVDEFDTWTMTYDGKATAVTAQGLIDGDTDGPLVDVSFHVDAKMAVPPWIQGTMGKNAVPESKNNGIEDDGINARIGVEPADGVPQGLADRLREGVDRRVVDGDDGDAAPAVDGDAHGRFSDRWAGMAQAASGRRHIAQAKRPVTKAASVRLALPAGLRPVTWKSLKAALWLT